MLLHHAALCFIFDINNKLIQQYPLFSLMAKLMLCLPSCFFSFSPPLTSMEKGTPLENISPPSLNCFSTEYYADQFGEKIIPSFC